ncbi:hypothetical protein OQA88_4492 [Cercophora sp. LCS_1]
MDQAQRKERPKPPLMRFHNELMDLIYEFYQLTGKKPVAHAQSELTAGFHYDEQVWALNWRLTCRRFDGVAVPQLFKRIFITPQIISKKAEQGYPLTLSYIRKHTQVVVLNIARLDQARARALVDSIDDLKSIRFVSFMPRNECWSDDMHQALDHWHSSIPRSAPLAAIEQSVDGFVPDFWKPGQLRQKPKLIVGDNLLFGRTPRLHLPALLMPFAYHGAANLVSLTVQQISLKKHMRLVMGLLLRARALKELAVATLTPMAFQLEEGGRFPPLESLKLTGHYNWSHDAQQVAAHWDFGQLKELDFSGRSVDAFLSTIPLRAFANLQVLVLNPCPNGCGRLASLIGNHAKQLKRLGLTLPGPVDDGLGAELWNQYRDHVLPAISRHKETLETLALDGPYIDVIAGTRVGRLVAMGCELTGLRTLRISLGICMPDFEGQQSPLGSIFDELAYVPGYFPAYLPALRHFEMAIYNGEMVEQQHPDRAGVLVPPSAQMLKMHQKVADRILPYLAARRESEGLPKLYVSYLSIYLHKLIRLNRSRLRAEFVGAFSLRIASTYEFDYETNMASKPQPTEGDY